ncbi:MAG: HepT-like ribonuclease domain-containing protein [Candidatus Methanomethylicia archaeon]
MIVRDRLSTAEGYVNLLRILWKKVRNVKELSKDLILRGAVERYLQLSIEAIIDVGFRICSILGLEKPERYRDIAKILLHGGF